MLCVNSYPPSHLGPVGAARSQMHDITTDDSLSISSPIASTSIFAVSSRMSECSQKAVDFATNAKRCIRLALICLRSMCWRQVLAARTSARTTLRERTSPVLTRGMLAHQQPHISTGSRVFLDSDFLC